MSIMKHPRKRATAKSRAAKRKPPAIRNPKPHIPAPMAPRFTPEPFVDDGWWDGAPEIPGFWERLWRRLF